MFLWLIRSDIYCFGNRAQKIVLNCLYQCSNKNFACAGQLIVMTLIQAVKLPTTMVTGLPSPFDKNKLELECRVLAIKKTFVKTLQVKLCSVFLNVPIKHVQEKEKEIFYLNFSSIATSKKQR